MKKSLSILAVCALALSANAESDVTDALGRHNNTAHYAKNINVKQNASAEKSNFNALKKASRDDEPDRGLLTMAEYQYLYGNHYWLNNSFLSEADYLKKIAWEEERFGFYNEKFVVPDFHTGWYYDDGIQLLNRSRPGNLDSVFVKSAYTRDSGAEGISLVSDDYACASSWWNGETQSYATNWGDRKNDGTMSDCYFKPYSGGLAVLMLKTANAEVASSFNRFPLYDGTTEHFYPMPHYHNYPVGIVNGRFGSVRGERGVDAYDFSLTAELDRYVFNHHVIYFAGAGNDGDKGKITEFGRAFNAITVGSAGGDNSNLNPIFGTKVYDKPEIVNYSYFNIYGLTVKGTEAAAAYSAAQTANFLHSRPFYKWHPEAMKALLLTSSTKEVFTTRGAKSNKKILKGAVAYNSMVAENRSRFWFGNNGDMPTNNTLAFEETEIVKGKKYRIAICWLVDPDIAKKYNAVPLGFSLKATQYNDDIQKDYSIVGDNPNQVLQFIEFVARSNEPIRIQIQRKVNKDSSHKIYLGYNILEM